MNAEPTNASERPAASERLLCWLYGVATFVCFSLLDDAAMMAFALS